MKHLRNGLALLLVLATSLVACKGFIVDKQHAACTSDADCPSGDGLLCLQVIGSTESRCEIPCDPMGAACPLEQSCETATSFGEPVCYEPPA